MWSLGDAVKSEVTLNPTKTVMPMPVNCRANTDLNQGNYLDDEIGNTSSTDFCIGVSGYPEKHMKLLV